MHIVPVKYVAATSQIMGLYRTSSRVHRCAYSTGLGTVTHAPRNLYTAALPQTEYQNQCCTAGHYSPTDLQIHVVFGHSSILTGGADRAVWSHSHVAPRRNDGSKP